MCRREVMMRLVMSVSSAGAVDAQVRLGLGKRHRLDGGPAVRTRAMASPVEHEVGTPVGGSGDPEAARGRRTREPKRGGRVLGLAPRIHQRPWARKSQLALAGHARSDERRKSGSSAHGRG